MTGKTATLEAVHCTACEGAYVSGSCQRKIGIRPQIACFSKMLPSIFCHFLTRVDSFWRLLLGAEVLGLAPAVSPDMTKPYRSVWTGLMGVMTASEVASAQGSINSCYIACIYGTCPVHTPRVQLSV